MLVLSRKLGEKIVIGDNIVVTVVKIDRNQIRIGIEAPSDSPGLPRRDRPAARRAEERASDGRSPEPVTRCGESRSGALDAAGPGLRFGAARRADRLRPRPLRRCVSHDSLVGAIPGR